MNSAPGPSGPLDKRDWIAGLEKGLSVIEAFDDATPRLTASQAGERCGMTRTAARRYLLTLAHLGYVASDGKLFWLTPRVLRLGQ
ncbi:MAG: helix-turn-helix domain-containing protein, partial [Burkholderiaceae bacterium]